MAYLYLFFNSLLVDIDQHRHRYPRLHNPANGRGSCPSQDRWPILCSCVRGGVTNRLRLRPIQGPTLVFVPASLLPTWHREWESMAIDTDLLQLYIHHHSFPGEAVSNVRRHNLRLSATEDGSFTLKSPISHQFMVLTTIESYIEQVVKYFGNLNGRERALAASTVDLKSSHDGLGWARVVRDEAHITNGWETKFFTIMRSFVHRQYRPPNLLALTATPMLKQGLGDVQSLVRIINAISPGIADHPDYAAFATDGALKTLVLDQKALRDAQREGQDVDEAEVRRLADMTGRLQVAYSLRRRNSSVQNNKALASLPPIKISDVRCNVPPCAATLQLQRVEWLFKTQRTEEFKAYKRKWQEEHPGEEMKEIEHKLFLDNAALPRILATIPHLANYGKKDYFHWRYIEQKGWHESPEESIFYTDLGWFRSSSGKLQQLRNIIFDLGKDVDGKPEKIVIVSEFPAVCLAVLAVSTYPFSTPSVLLTKISARPCTGYHGPVDACQHGRHRERILGEQLSGRERSQRFRGAVSRAHRLHSDLGSRDHPAPGLPPGDDGT